MKIVKMKELAVSYKLKNAKKFKTTEQYLEYVIDEINSRANKFSFHQFLFLIDVFYVLLDDKQENKTDRPLTTENEIDSHYTRPLTDAEAVKAFTLQQDVYAKEAKAIQEAKKEQNIQREDLNAESPLFNEQIDW